jgi:alpha-amylase/alpha-mannosidase (GH57 family)
MPAPVLVVHGHFYQPPRENPWTESVAAELSAAPAHDWNERITDESYRPNGWARVIDDQGKVVAIVDNYAHLSFNAGPTLLSWMEVHAPDVLARMVEGDRAGGGAIAQAYNHMILPLASERDVRTQVRWGVADFRHRFGREPAGMWLPETAVNDDVLRVLAQEGVGFTILAPSQAGRVRALAAGSLLGHEEPWHDVADGSIDTRRTYRWVDPTDEERVVDLLFYDGALSHDVAFGIGAMRAEGLVARAARDGLTTVAADGETFGHHHHFAERLLAYALPVAAPRAGVQVRTAAAHLAAQPPTWQAEVKESAWSCAHGVGRWREDCGCSTGGPPGANQRWRAPLRAALDLLRDAGVEVFERRGAVVFRDPWAARDAYVEVLLGRSLDDFAAEHVIGDLGVARTLLEQQRHALLMYTSCAWFFWDLAGLETAQCLRYAARAADLLHELGEAAPMEAFLDQLAHARSNQPGEGDGVRVWHRHVEPARVDASRVAAHLALRSVLEGQQPAGAVAVWDVVDAAHDSARRGSVTVAAGRVTLRHRRTGRTSRHAYGVVHLGGLEVAGAVRAAGPSDVVDAKTMVASLERGERVTTLLRLVSERYGPDEFGIERALPDAAEEIVVDAAAALEDRFLTAIEQLYLDHRATLASLTSAGVVLADHLRRPMARALGRRLEAEIAAHGGAWEPDAYGAAADLVAEAASHGLVLDAPGVRVALGQAVLAATIRACAGEGSAVEAATALLDLADALAVSIDLAAAQELVYDALSATPASEGLGALGARLGLAVDHLGLPD